MGQKLDAKRKKKKHEMNQNEVDGLMVSEATMKTRTIYVDRNCLVRIDLERKMRNNSAWFVFCECGQCNVYIVTEPVLFA